MTDSFNRYLETCQQRINHALSLQLQPLQSRFVQTDTGPLLETLYDAMRYSLLIGGKRIRPMLVYAGSSAVNPAVNPDCTDQLACAVEMIHAYSLIHDDLPAMDDDDLRRGQPSCHRAFDEATAILAGDALQAQAFNLLTDLAVAAELRLALIRTLSEAAGPAGMVGGQMIDLAATGRTIALDHLEALHRLKTGALIRAAVTMGGQLAGADATQLDALDRYGAAIGLAYQVRDDILDVEGDTRTLGKNQGADAQRNKPTYASLLGLGEARQLAVALHDEAITALEHFDQHADPLRQLAAYIIARLH